MIANGAQSVIAQDKPTHPMTYVPPVGEVTRMVENIAIAKSRCEAIQTLAMSNFPKDLLWMIECLS